MSKRTVIIFSVVALLLVATAAVSLNLPPPHGKYVDAVQKGTEWFANNQDDNFLYYEYDPKQDEYSESHHSMREMGAMWSIAKAANFFTSNEYSNLAEKGFRYFESSFKFDSGQNMYFVNVTPHKIKLGYNAFAILTLLELDHPDQEKYIPGLVNGIRFLQNDDGSLRTFFYSDRRTGVDYYPGEALFALMTLYEKNGDSELLQMTEKAFPYYVDYWRDNQNTGFIPWQTRAYRKLYDATKKKEVADFVFEMNDWLLDQHPSADGCQDFEFPNGNVTAVFMEGVIQSYELAKSIGEDRKAECYANFVQDGAEYLLTLQITDTTKYPESAIGGFQSSERNSTLRVDNNQHSITALIEAYEAGLIR